MIWKTMLASSGIGRALLLILGVTGLVPSWGYMTNYACNKTSQIIADQGLTTTGQPGKIEFMCYDYIKTYSYMACDLDDDPQLGFNPSCNNTFSIQVYSNFQRALSVYNCKEYSRIWTCDNCTAAYKRWLCAALFRRCENSTNPPDPPTCETNFSRTNDKALPDCVMKTCQDVCYDVVRKCPVHLEFRCPPVTDFREYTTKACNNLERESQNDHASTLVISVPLLLVSLMTSVYNSWSF